MAPPTAHGTTGSATDLVADRRTRLLLTAAELFFTKPYDSVTTSEIASRSGVAYGLIAHHFGNKRGLYLEAIRHAAERFKAANSTPLAGDTHLERLRSAITRHVDHADTHFREFYALTRGDLGSDPDLRAIVDDLRSDAARMIVAELGAPDPPPPLLDAAIRSWIALLDSLVADRLTTGDLTKDQIVDLASAAMVQVIGCVRALDPDLDLPVRPEHDIRDLYDHIHRRIGSDTATHPV